MKALPPLLSIRERLELARLLRFEFRFDGGMHVNHVHAAVKTDRGLEHERELQRVPGPFRSAHARGGEKNFPSDLLIIGAISRLLYLP